MKNICIFLCSILFCLNTYADFEVCIHSKIYHGMSKAIDNDPNQELQAYQRLAIKMFGDGILGHASIEIKNNGNTIRSYGYWPEENLMVNSDHVDKNSTAAYIINNQKVTNSIASKCYPMPFAAIEKIEIKAQLFQRENGPWSDWNNCVKFASHIFNEISGINMNTSLPLPKALYQAIKTLKGSHLAHTTGEEYSQSNETTVSQ